MKKHVVKSLKFWLLAMVAALLAIAGFSGWENLAGWATSPDSLAERAAQFTQEGHRDFDRGNAESAFQNWREAEAIYLEMERPEGVTGSRINQSLALLAMGQSVRACKVLVTALSQEIGDRLIANSDLCLPQTEAAEDFLNVPFSELNALGLRHLGNVLRALGKPELSQLAFRKSLEMARSLSEVYDKASSIDAALLGLGNTEEALYQKKLELWRRTDRASYRNSAIEHAQAALDVYAQVGEAKRYLADLNRLSLLWKLVENTPQFPAQKQEDNAPTSAAQYSFSNSILPLARELLNTPIPQENFTPIEQIYARLTLTRLLAQIYWERTAATNFFEAAVKAAEEARERSERLTENLRVRSEVLGTLGYVYERSPNSSQAREYTQTALNLARAIHAADLVAQWAWQQGRIDKSSGNFDGAIAAYQMAIDHLDFVRKDLLNLNSDWQFSFQNNVKPLYEEFIDLLLRSPQPTQRQIQKALEVSDRFQTAELENFLKCNLIRSDILTPSQVKAKTVVETAANPGSAAIIRIIVLEKFNRAIEIVQSPNSELFYHEIAGKNWEETQQEISALTRRLNSNALRTTDVATALQTRSQAIYRQLIAPIQSAFPPQGTLVFLLDSRLQGIPMAMLQNERGESLIQHYRVTLNFPTQLGETSANSSEDLRVFAAGLSIQGDSFDRVSPQLKPLPQVDDELRAIQEVAAVSSILRDRDFTVDKFTQRVQTLNFGILHIATHGQFSSVPEDTFILAYDDKLNINQLENVLRDRTEGTRQNLDLLVLSACQTAKDDKRGGLGLAGVSLRAGAKSTIASLWNISDRSTALFIKEFYIALEQSNFSKAEALRQAQLQFLTHPQYTNLGYNHPYYWAAFVLVGAL